MQKSKHRLIAFVGATDRESTVCYKAARDFLMAKDFMVYRCDAMYPFRVSQDQLYRNFLMGRCGEATDPALFNPDEQLMHYLLEMFEIQAPKVLAESVKHLASEHSANPVAVITTDARNKVFTTMQGLGYFFIRIEKEGLHKAGEKNEEHLVEEDYLVSRKDFRRSPWRALEAALDKAVRNKVKGFRRA